MSNEMVRPHGVRPPTQTRAAAADTYPTPWYMHIYIDYRRYRATGDSWFTTLLTDGFWATSMYRFGRGVVGALRFRPLRRMIRVGFAIIQKVLELITGVMIPLECEIDEGICIGHHGTIIFPSHGKLGKNCNVAHNVTIGLAGHGANRGAPVIGDRVYIGVNAVVVGKIIVGNDAVICPNSFVTRSVPPRAVMVGNPARVISYDGSFEYIQYDGMEKDPDRLAALASATPRPPAGSTEAAPL